MDERVTNSCGEAASNDEYRKLNTDFLLLSALIKDHKAKKTQQPQSSSGVGSSTSLKAHPHFVIPSRPAQLTFQSNFKYVTNNPKEQLGRKNVHISDALQGSKAHNKDRKWVRMKNDQPMKYQLRGGSREPPKTRRKSSDGGKTRNICSSVSYMKESHNLSSKCSGALFSENSDLKRRHGPTKTVTLKSNLDAKLLATKQAMVENRQKLEWLTKQAEKAHSVKRESLISKHLQVAARPGDSLGESSLSLGLRKESLPTEAASLLANSRQTKAEKSWKTNLPIAKYVSCANIQKSNANQPTNPQDGRGVDAETSVEPSLSKGQVLPTTAKHKSLHSNVVELHCKPSASERLDSVRTAHKESLKILEKAERNSPFSSEQMQDKNCEIARVQALSAYLTKLKEKDSAKCDNTAAESSKVVRESVKGRNPVPGKQSTLRLPQSVSKVPHLRTGNVAANHLGDGGACNALPCSQQAGGKYLSDRIEGKADSSRSFPSQTPMADSTESDEVRRLKSDIAILNAKINKKHLENRIKGGGAKKCKYVWTPHSQHLSGSSHKTKVMAKRTKLLKRKSPQVVSKSVNRFVKINPSAKSRSLTSGNRSLVKTRTRYKVRKSYQKTTPKRVRGTGHEQGRRPNDKQLHGDNMRSGRNSSKSLRRNKKEYGPHIPQNSRFHRINTSKQYHHNSKSAFNIRNHFHGHQNSPYKMQWSTGRKHLWDKYKEPSFVTRRLQHMVEHSPMLFRSNPFLGRHRSFRRLDQIWHNPRIMAKRIHWQGRRTPLRMQTAPRKRPSTDSGGRPSKKVMNVVNINGVRYSRHGKSLKRLPGTSEEKKRKGVTPMPSPKVTNTKIAAQQVLHRSIFLSRTSKLRKARKQDYCMFFNRFGRCHKGTSCPYKHDPDKVAICTRFLRGMCNKASGVCPFSHKVSKDRMPVCRFFLKGICTQVDCPYSHIKVSNSATICRDFVQGYCARGEKCTKKHLLECAEYSQKGSCPRKRCPLWHKKKRRLSGQGQQKGRNSSLNSRALKKQGELTANPRGSSFIELKGEETSYTELESGLEDEVVQPLQIRPVFQTVTDSKKA